MVKLFGAFVHWASVRQSLTVLSSCEAELAAAVTGVNLGSGVRHLVSMPFSSLEWYSSNHLASPAL
eukprot:3342507-Prorocentrum_lima.AAC.1